MRSRAARILMLGWLAVWFGVVLPGHQRGRIVMPGGEQPCHDQAADAAPMPDSCCAPPASSGGGSRGGGSGGESTPSPADVRNCAICHVALRLTPTPVIEFTLPRVGVLETLPVPAVAGLDSVAGVDAPNARGPPAV